MEKFKVVMLCGGSVSSQIIYNNLMDKFNVVCVIYESPQSKVSLIKKRCKKLGAFTVFGQLLFQVIMQKYLKLQVRDRVNQLYKKYKLNVKPIANEKIKHVDSINTQAVKEILIRENPDVVMINGTRIIAIDILNCIPARFINIHMGITPKYRGVHGGYWALANDDLKNFGATIHLVDSGIDTGDILVQKTIEPTKQDNFMSYPVLQLAAVLPYLNETINSVVQSTYVLRESFYQSHLWYHPTIWRYCYNRIAKKIK